VILRFLIADSSVNKADILPLLHVNSTNVFVDGVQKVERIVTMITKALRFLKALRSRQLLAIGMARAAATAPLRMLDPSNPISWEFRALSQHGEDGILDYLTGMLSKPNRYLVEIGCGDGTENNSTWFVLSRYWRGLMTDGKTSNVEWARYLLQPLNYGVTFRTHFVTVENIQSLINDIAVPDPDFLSLDIDGNDYWVMKSLLDAGIRPKILVVEYNSAFGPKRRISIPYQPAFVVQQGFGPSLYFGCSIAGWRALMQRCGYHFITVESAGANAFFAAPEAFAEGFLDTISGETFRENVSHLREYAVPWTDQYKLIEPYDLAEI